MARRRFSLTPEVQNSILAYIREGGFPHIAAEAAGVPAEVFHDWIKKGQQRRAREPYRSFATQVRQAIAQIRLLTEIDVRKDDPRFWLLKGPGRETPNNPGWTRETKPLIVQDNRTVNLLASPQWNSLWAIILQALAEFPEARLALAQALKEAGAVSSVPQQTFRSSVLPGPIVDPDQHSTDASSLRG
jgi:hypothetical protein